VNYYNISGTYFFIFSAITLLYIIHDIVFIPDIYRLPYNRILDIEEIN